MVIMRDPCTNLQSRYYHPDWWHSDLAGPWQLLIDFCVLSKEIHCSISQHWWACCWTNVLVKSHFPHRGV